MQEELKDGARLPSLDLEKLRVENTTLKEEQHRLKKVRLSAYLTFAPAQP